MFGLGTAAGGQLVLEVLVLSAVILEFVFPPVARVVSLAGVVQVVVLELRLGLVVSRVF